MQLLPSGGANFRLAEGRSRREEEFSFAQFNALIRNSKFLLRGNPIPSGAVNFC